MNGIEDTITISVKRLKELLDAEDRLQCLDKGGVDNWDWYSYSLSEYGYFKRLEEGIYDVV